MLFLNLAPGLLALCLASAAWGAQASPADDEELYYSDVPTYFALDEDLSSFVRFADGGPDDNWYVGFNNAWIVKLPPAPAGEYTRAFIGAKLGRSKTLPRRNSSERAAVPGKIYMAISPRAAFSPEQSFFLAETREVPAEPDAQDSSPGTGHSEWFWKEVPLNLVSFTEPNYLIIWSPNNELRDARHAPILAAADPAPDEAAGPPRAWNNHSLQGVPPRVENGTLQVPINLKPALALKLTPAPGGGVAVPDLQVRPQKDRILVRFSTEGKNIELAWVELSTDEFEWRRVSGMLRHPPFLFSIPRDQIPPRGAYLRGKARDELAVEGHSKSVLVPGQGTR